MSMEDLYLVHHGRLGQKWGKKNGPPYPLEKKVVAEEYSKSNLKKRADKYRAKADNYKTKIPSHYFTVFGKAKAEKYTRKALAAEGKAYKIEKKIQKKIDKKATIDSSERVFVSGSSKTQNIDSEYFRKKLPKAVRKELDETMKKKYKILVGDAPGIDTQVQDYLNKKKYPNVEVYGPGKKVRYAANSNWETKPINDPKHKEGSKEWLAKKDEAMTKNATKGLAVTLDEGSRATKANVDRLINQYKDVKVYELSKLGKRHDKWKK